jgi:hypothetical protein
VVVDSADDGYVVALSPSARLSQEGADVEEEVGNFGRGHQLAVPQLAETPVDDGQGLADHLVECTGLGHGHHPTGKPSHGDGITHIWGDALRPPGSPS